MFLKLLDDLELEREDTSKLAGKEFKPAIEPPYGWSDLVGQSDGITGDELLSFFRNEETTLPNFLRSAAKRGPGKFKYLRGLTSSDSPGVANACDVIPTVFRGVRNRNDLPIAAALAIHLFIGGTTALAAETENGKGSGGFAYPVISANRRFIDQTGQIYLLKTMSSWAMSQNCSDTEITQALEGLKALRFNAVTVSLFGVHMNDSFGDRYKSKAGQSFFSGKPHASTLGPAWSSMDSVMREATRLEMTVVFSFFLSWKDTGTVPDLIAGGTTNAYNFGKSVATRYAGYSNIVWHVMGDFRRRYNPSSTYADGFRTGS